MKTLFFLVMGILAFAHGAAAVCTAPTKGEAVDVPGHPFAAVSTSDSCWLFASIEMGRSRGAIAVLRNQDGHFVLDHQVPIEKNVFGETLSHDGRLLAIAAGSDTALFDVPALQRGDAKALLGMLHNGGHSGAIYAAISLDDKLLFVSDEDERKIAVFDLVKARSDNFRSDATIGRIPTASAPVGLALSPDGRWLYATSEVGPMSTRKAMCAPEARNDRSHPPGVLLVVDVNKASTDPGHAMVSAFPAGCNPVRVAPSPDGKQVWVTARGDNRLLRFRVEDWSAGADRISSTSFPIGKSPVGVAVRPDGRQVWVALSNRFGKDSAGQLAGIADATDDSPTKLMSAPAPGFPREVTFLPDGRTIVTTLFDANQIEFIPSSD
jgi:DNA-binding beta-propeller fold protein YncE